MSKINVCVRCSTWRYKGLILTNFQKDAVITLIPFLLKIEFEEEVCANCRMAIGDEVSDEMLKIVLR